MKRIYKMKSRHVTTERLWDKVNCKSTKNDRHLFGIFRKKFNKSVTIRKKFVTIKQLIELNKALNQIIKGKIYF